MSEFRLALPVKTFVEAVLLTVQPCGDRQIGHPAIERITRWWNETAPVECRCAFAFMYYVRYQGADWPAPFWFSGCFDEGYVSDQAMGQGKPKVEAELGDNIILTFWQRSTTEWDEEEAGRGWYSALDVAGGEGPSGGTGEHFSGDMVETRDTYDALKTFPSRFPASWAAMLAQSGLIEAPRLQRYTANGDYFHIEPQPSQAAA